ncbi:MAG TPA: chemotaxis protein CheX [Polyangiaceae bacterium]|jgi:hypothetical protein
MTDGRTTLRTIVQGSTVDLFHSCDIAVGPIERYVPQLDAVPYHDLSASIGFTGRGFTGTLTLGMPPEVFSLAKQDNGRGYDMRDWVREITNQLCGRIKSRLLQFQITLKVGLPATLTREAFERHKGRGPFFGAYFFRTLRGEVVVTLGGEIRNDVFVYSGVTESASEGDIIIF